jgi:hypothetical protein
MVSGFGAFSKIHGGFAAAAAGKSSFAAMLTENKDLKIGGGFKKKDVSADQEEGDDFDENSDNAIESVKNITLIPKLPPAALKRTLHLIGRNQR